MFLIIYSSKDDWHGLSAPSSSISQLQLTITFGVPTAAYDVHLQTPHGVGPLIYSSPAIQT